MCALRSALALGSEGPASFAAVVLTLHRRTDSNPAGRSALALRFWNEARDPRGTGVPGYLASRGLKVPDDIGGEVMRFHPTLKFDSKPVRGMVALFRAIKTNEPCGVHRTF